MAKCDACGQSILFGGAREGDLRFCNETCRAQGLLMGLDEQVHEDLISAEVARLRDSACPKCSGPGPVDVHTSHTVWSMFVMTRCASKPELCCESCGSKAKYQALASSMVLGWWGIPWGLVWTPIQVGRNIKSLISTDTSRGPSPELVKIVKMQVATAARNSA